MKSILFKLTLILGALATLPNHIFAQPPKVSKADSTYIREHYTKSIVRIPMRDGVKLFTIVYAPKAHDVKYPILLNRTPYSVWPYDIDKYNLHMGPLSFSYVKEGYIFVEQDVRGRYMSEGTFVANRPYIPNKTKNQVDESSDSYDTIDWLVKNIPDNNGKVGVYGVSSPGFYATMATIDSHPALKAVSPQAPVTDWFMGDDRHHNGAFFLMGSFNFLSYFGAPRPAPTQTDAMPFNQYGTPDAYDFYKRLGPIKNVNERYFKGKNAIWNDMMENDTYNAFWKSRSPLPHLKKIKPATLVVGGWFDQEDPYGPLKTFGAIDQQKPVGDNYLVMGPWTHGSWMFGKNDVLGDIRFNAETGPYYREHIELNFFNHYLKGYKNTNEAKATIFETGSNQWKHYTAWPPVDAKTKNLYFQPNGKLSFSPPAADATGFDEYLSDPDKPVPYTQEIRIDRGSNYMVEDQRFASRRPDVLTYETDALENDLVISGNLKADLFISTTGTDADFIVKLIDVYPNDAPNDSPMPNTKMGGFQLMVRGEVMRAKFRKSFSEPSPLVPGEITEVGFDMQDAAHCFKKGHKIMVQVQSSWFPLVDRNPQKFVNIYKASESDFQKATHRVYFKGNKSSHLELSVLDHNGQR